MCLSFFYFWKKGGGGILNSGFCKTMIFELNFQLSYLENMGYCDVLVFEMFIIQEGELM